MSGSQVLTKYRHVPDEEWNQIPFIKEVQGTKNFGKYYFAMCDLHSLTSAQAAAELFLGVFSQNDKRRTLKGCLEAFRVAQRAYYAIDTSMCWRDTVQGDYFWREVSNECVN